jgi:uncharacterized DUF497 family protein
MRGGILDVTKLVELYLDQVRKCITQKRYTMESEDKRRLTELGISFRDASHIISRLTYQDYVSGPSQDHLYPEQSVYVFGYQLDDIELYIKLTFRKVDNLFILSFHEAKYPLQYPFR